MGDKMVSLNGRAGWSTLVSSKVINTNSLIHALCLLREVA